MAATRRRPGPQAIRFRINRKEPLIVLEVKINGEGPFNFALDTGASLTVISPAVARRAGVDSSGARARATGAGGRLHVRMARLRSLMAGNVEVKGLEVVIMSLGALNRATSLKLGGIIGYNLLRRYRVTIDYPAGRLFLEPPDP